MKHNGSNSPEQTPTKRPKVEMNLSPIESYTNINSYDLVGSIGEGTFGKVFKARNKNSGELFAIKLLKLAFVSPYCSREIRFLDTWWNEHLVEMIGVVKDYEKDRFGIVLELMNFSLSYVIRMIKTDFEENHIRWLLHQILSGVRYLHSKNLIHRNLEPSNLLLNRDGTLKIAGLGCSCEYYFDSPVPNNFDDFGTMSYQAPEILLGASDYSTKVDLWSVGCIFAELILRKPLFTGVDDEDLVENIFQILGTPTQRTWPGVQNLPGMKMFENKRQHSGCLLDLFKERQFKKKGRKLLENLLQLNPKMRLRAVEADLDDYPYNMIGIYDPSEFAEWLQSNLEERET